MFGLGKNSKDTIKVLSKLQPHEAVEVAQAKGLTSKEFKELPKAHQQAIRATLGDKGLKGFLAAFDGSGSKNYHNNPVENRVHPSRHREELTREIKRAVKSGDVVAQIRLRAEAEKHGYL